MPHRYELNLTAGAIATHFGCRASALPLRRELLPMQMAPVIRAGAKPELMLMRWGLVPRWAPNPSFGAAHTHASVSALMTPAYQDAFLNRHCLVPATAFLTVETLNGGTAMFRYERNSKRVFAFAGVWDRWRSPAGEVVDGFAVITLAPASQPADGGWPVVVAAKDYALWLSHAPADAGPQAQLLRPSGERWLRSSALSPDDIGGIHENRPSARSAAPGFMRSTGRLHGLGWYHLNLLSATGGIVGRDDFQARDDDKARAIAALIHDACADRASTYELWQAERRIAPAGAIRTRPNTALDEARQQVQRIAIEREEVLIRSRTAVARSERLLKRLAELRQGTVAGRPGPSGTDRPEAATSRGKHRSPAGEDGTRPSVGADDSGSQTED